jgi:hypothetical protein
MDCGAGRSPEPPRRANPIPSRRPKPIPPRRPKPIHRADRSQSTAPTEANPRRRTNPIRRAERTQSAAPSEPGRASLVRNCSGPCGGAGEPGLGRPAAGLARSNRYHRRSGPGRSPDPRRGADSRPRGPDDGLKPTHDPRGRIAKSGMPRVKSNGSKGILSGGTVGYFSRTSRASGVDRKSAPARPDDASPPAPNRPRRLGSDPIS